MKKQMLLCLVTLSALLPLSGCSNNKQFKNWNECDALTTLKNYVKDVTNKICSECLDNIL